MTLSYTLDHDRYLADVRASGKVTLSDAIHAVRGVAADVAHDGYGCLVDVREMDFFPTIMELKEISFEFIRLRAAFRAGTAFIVSNDRHYGLGRFLAMLVDTAGIRMAVFKDPAQAEHWLHTHTGAHKVRAKESRAANAPGAASGQTAAGYTRPTPPAS
jgi:hypothetical protein